MIIKSLQLKNFKRFTDLTLTGVPEDNKLVLLIGSNGSGKSSVFDAFEVLNRFRFRDFTEAQDSYYSKGKRPFHVIAEFSDGARLDSEKKKVYSDGARIPLVSFYGRTSFRQIPRLSRTRLGQGIDITRDSDKPYAFIDRDVRFENDLEHIFGRLLKEFFRNDDKSQIKATVITPINDAFERIFSKANGTKLELIELIPPIEGQIAEINFKKGDSHFHYNQLSAGEKEIFNILINLIARQDYYQSGILYFDEIDLHLNTKLQYNFLKEIVEHWIPEHCQFWTASHSLGFIQYAKESSLASVFDFDDLDFDYPKVLVPEEKDNPNLYQIAVDKDILPSLFQHFNIVFVENEDKKYYGALDIERTIFVPENNRNGVYHKVKSGNYQGIVDRDFLTDEDIQLIEQHYNKLHLLKYYSIENYLYHPSNLEEYYIAQNVEYSKADYIRNLTVEKNNVKNSIVLKISMARLEYPYFKEPSFNDKKQLQKRFKNETENIEQAEVVASYLNSEEFETFYKVFPMKSYARLVPERQNINKSKLAKTNWFKEQIVAILKKTV